MKTKISKAWAIIPAHLHSERLPGKVLLRHKGKSILQYVYEAAKSASLVSRVSIATDSDEIETDAKGFGAEVIRTKSAPDGTDRACQAVREADKGESLVINVQGDEPEISPNSINLAILLLNEDKAAQISTLATELLTWEEILDPNQVKVVTDGRSRALMFSRAPIPYFRGSKPANPPKSTYFGHIGLYCYRKDALLLMGKLKNTPIGDVEKLEQLKALHYGLRIAVGVVEKAPKGIDTYSDWEQFQLRNSH